jgi:hypothetical protein
VSKATSYHKTILTSDSGTGSVNLSTPVSGISNARIESGVGTLAVEAKGTLACRLMVSGGVLDGEVVVAWDEA